MDGFGSGRGCGMSAGGTPTGPARALQVVRAYWEALRGPDGAPPERAALDPRALAPALEWVFIGERIGRGLVRLRITGTGLAELGGIDMQGLPLSALFLPEARPALADAAERVFSRAHAAEIGLEAEQGIGRPALGGRLLMLPLTSTRGTTDLMLGCLATEGRIGRAPRRFGIGRVVDEDTGIIRPAGIAAQIAAALAEPATTATGAPKGRAHLRLVHSA